MIENVIIRGRLVETLITSDDIKRNELLLQLKNMQMALPTIDTKNGLGDYVREFEDGKTITDVKTKIIYLDSNPKAYNIDKFLDAMDNSNSIFFIYFVGIDELKVTNKILCSVYDKRLIKATTFQQHWSGRSRRGTTQFIGKEINTLLKEEEFKNIIEVKTATELLNKFIQL